MTTSPLIPASDAARASRRDASVIAGDDPRDIPHVGMIGPIKAIDRFELSREVEFTSFALSYIVGEIKRLFRCTTWAVHVPCILQELRVELSKAREELAGRLNREPSIAELATLMGLSEDEVVEARIAVNGYNSSSLDAALTSNGGQDGEAVPRNCRPIGSGECGRAIPDASGARRRP